MVFGNFRESICKEIGLDDVEAVRLLKLLQLACGEKGLVAKDIEELLELGELSERLQMEAVRSEIEDALLKVLRIENCLEMIEQSEARGLNLLQKGCYKMLRDEFGVISQKAGFLRLSEETMGAFLEEDELAGNGEEEMFEAVVRWISNCDDGMRGVGLLRKIRFGLMSNEYLAVLMVSALLPGDGVVKELVEEAMAKMEGAGRWDGVERLCDKWMVGRGMKGRIIGDDVLINPRYAAMDRQGRILVSDSELHQIIVFNHDGSVARRIGSEGSAAGQFSMPMGIAVDGQGHIVVADKGNDRIQVLNADGSVVRCFGSRGTAVGQFNEPWGLAIDKEGHIVVADRLNDRIQVFDLNGSVLRHFGSRGITIGEFQSPMGVAVDGAGRIAVVEWFNQRVQVFNGDGSATLCFGSRGSALGNLSGPRGVCVDSAGRFVVADTDNHRVQVFNPDGSVARVIPAGDGVDELDSPVDVMVDGAGRIFVVECGDNQVQVF